ncbi:MAG: hypothetical protein A2104_02810 [Candidatus Melainabacteria bacterium GWF2_32_7]|nr:MAG: hypothetical protein A2104_02810 [Candidatus Melainabacteria bacterium GWF2_32_7]
MAYIEGTDSYNVLKGTSGDDIYNARGGNDYTTDYAGNDTYIFNLGDGQDTMRDSGGSDMITFGTGITLNDLQFVRYSNNFIIRIRNTTDKMDIYSWFTNPAYKIEKMQFTDGTVITAEDAENILETDKIVVITTGYSDSVQGTTGNEIYYVMGGSDTIYDPGGNDIVEAASGDDVITDMDGNDIYFPSWGNDTIMDYQGNDTYFFDLGDAQDVIYDYGGTDTINFGDGITKDSLSISQVGNNQVVSINGISDKITILDWYVSNQNIIERFVFSDGSVLNFENTNPPTNPPSDPPNDPPPPTNPTDPPEATVIGTDGNDTFKYYNGNDVYYAGKGNDRINDYSGNDTYLLNQGDGRDTITDTSGSDTIRFGSGITQNDISFERNGSALSISIKDSSDGITVIDWFNKDKYKIEKIEFSDGTVLSAQNVENIINGVVSIIDGTNNSEVLKGTVSADTINAGAGNDTIYGYGGDDVITGGTGNDIIYGSSENDTYIFNLGDGQDVIQDSNGDDRIRFGSGISESNLEFSQDIFDLIVSIKNSSDKITIISWFNSDQSKIEKFIFADGSILESGNIVIPTNPPNDPPPPTNPTDPPEATVMGTDGYDLFSGYNGNDVYYGKKGGDRYKDYWGSDTYLLNKGDGWDTITDTNGNDTIRFGSDITQNDVSFERNGNALAISIENSSDGITVIDWFTQDKYKIEKVEFEDGSYLRSDDINLAIQQIATYSINGNLDVSGIDDTSTPNDLILVNSY